MSTVSKSVPRKSPGPEPDPYCYGWRDVRMVAPDGTETFDQVPLTLEDVLFPEPGDFIVQTDAHDSDRAYLKAVFNQAKVPFYLIADASGRGVKRRLTLIGYRYGSRSYQRVMPDEKGRIYLEAVGLWIGVTRNRRGGYDRLACYDPETGQELGDYTAVIEALAEAKAEAQAAKQQAQTAKQQAEAAKQQAQTAKQQAEAARRQARLETKARAEAEARAREAEARIRELEVELKRSRGRRT